MKLPTFLVHSTCSRRKPDVPGPQGGTSFASVTHDDIYESASDGNMPSNYVPAVEKCFFETFEKGTLTGNPISSVRMVLRDGAFHVVDLPELPFRLTAIGAFREAYLTTKPDILEPIMASKSSVPSSSKSALRPLFSNMMTELGILGVVSSGLNARRVMVIDRGPAMMRSRL